LGSLGERLRNVRKHKDLTQKDLAERVNTVSKSTLNRIEANRINPSVSDIVAICGYLNISIDWLLTGEGDMGRQRGVILAEDEFLFITRFRKLNRDDRLRVLERIQALLDEKEKRYAARQETVRRAIRYSGLEGGGSDV